MNKLATLTIAVLTTMAATPSFSNPSVMGAGTVSCGRFLEMGDTNNVEMTSFTVSWVLGYLGGVDVMMSVNARPNLRAVDSQSVQAFITKSCRDKPLQTLAEASASLSLHLMTDLKNPK